MLSFCFVHGLPLVFFSYVSINCFTIKVRSFCHNIVSRQVEALNDAYMVASGLPLRNGSKHAEEIARFAMTIQKEMDNFKVPDLDQRTVQIRVAIHTGT